MASGEKLVKVKVLRGVKSSSALKAMLPAGEVTLASALRLADAINFQLREEARARGEELIEDFTYIDAIEGGLSRGDIAMCPFGPKFIAGIVLGDADGAPDGVRLKPINVVLSHLS